MSQRQGKYTITFQTPPSAIGFAAVASEKEGLGPLASYIDILNPDAYFGQTSWEKAESFMQKQAAEMAMSKCKLSPEDIQYALAGDLLNQCIGSSYGLRDLGMPYIGLFGACSTMAETLGLASILVESGAAQHAMAVTSSHFCSAERQFRFPLEYGSQRTPNSQWTVTGAGAVIVGNEDMPPFIRAITFGSIEDKGQKDMNNMGAAMAPAAAQTLQRFFSDTMTNQENYDLILTGDLAFVGSELFYQLMERDGYTLQKKHADCGLMIYDRENQAINAGGSGCGCAATVLTSYILPSMREGKLHDVLFIATGALMSTTSFQQGESIPGIAHLIHLSTTKNSG